MAQRAGADILEVDGSHVIMISQPQVVTDVILKALQGGELTQICEGLEEPVDVGVVVVGREADP